ncbi:DUF3368 domain-containing protein [Luteolibacter yonseiensis]|uniref:DUF3368 domain-containing protein n=1 Tax=Luteolibacter yonseiensis TaxID=1144680 RepID=A0A934QZV2_9BACT|nr:DUF3368 domain-containing protein [Luteolibacter yonseiensis]MBK1815793.1 DUF3368 domain-containing protein [Luteolibacter yonseiensis]
MNSIFAHPVVCNTGPLIGLARVRLEWLPFELFPEVLIPKEVHLELVAKDSPDGDRLELALGRAHIVPLQVQPDRLLLAELDSGEAAVIATALRFGLSSVLIDERRARRIASRVYGLEVKGTAGLLLEAKRRGMIDYVRPHLEGMVRGGYFLGPNLVAACLAAAGED